MTNMQVFCTGPKSESNFKTHDISLKSFLLIIIMITIIILIAELLARAKRAQSGAPWVRKFGKLSI